MGIENSFKQLLKGILVFFNLRIFSGAIWSLSSSIIMYGQFAWETNTLKIGSLLGKQTL